ncbi:RNaseH domain-containing protein [Geminocystis sp. CENA526]|uniref:RNaseH domain-containing protein n=1 Tax=Geminocystis sp. CENA526 TaxID=1355871 RepID=UPI003D6F8F62
MTTQSEFYTAIYDTGIKINSFFLAFTIPDKIEAVKVKNYTLSWTLEALAQFELIKTKIHDKNKNLPYASLRGLLQIYFDNLEYLHREINLKFININREKDIKPFAYLSYDDEDSINEELINKNFTNIFDNWTTHYLRPYVKKNNPSSLTIIDDLQKLLINNNLIKIEAYNFKILPWEWNTKKGKLYKDLVEYIARKIAGQEIFKNCGTMKRIISSNSLGGYTELMTPPISIEGKKGKFSLVITLEIVTFPTLHQPVLKIDVSKRRWIYQLTDNSYRLGDINGYVFDENYDDKVFQFKVKSEKNNDKYTWNIDQDFEPLRHKFQLSSQLKTGQDIISKASNEKTQVVLTFRHRLQDKKDNHDIGAGVPEYDKLTAYKAIDKILQPIGFIHFEKYQPVERKHPDSDNQINHTTLLSAILQKLDNNNSLKFTPEYCLHLSQEEKNNLLEKFVDTFKISLDNIDIDLDKKLQEFKTKISTKKNKEKVNSLILNFLVMEEEIKRNYQALEKLYPNDELLFIIFYQDDLKTDAEFVENIAQITLGKKVKVETTRLPKNVHGDKDNLPHKEKTAKERSQARIEEWKKYTTQLATQNKKIFCLILADEWYNGKHDDKVNKPSTRQALASLAGSAVQFLLPIERTKKGLIKLDNYFQRVQSALKDLFSAHSGRIDNVQEKINTYLSKIEAENRPKEIIGITIVRQEKGRVKSYLKPTYLLIASRLNVETGICDLRFAYDKNGQFLKSNWYHFVDGIKEVAKLSPVKLVPNNNNNNNDHIVAKKRFAEFLNLVISESVNNGNNPIILIDSSNCVKLCPWLADVRINPDNIHLNELDEDMQVNWKGARIIRIRQDIAPGFIIEKERRYAKTSLDDTRTKNELNCDYTIPSATSLTHDLFKLKTDSLTGCVTYLSSGKKFLHDNKRGLSCYQENETFKKDKNKKNSANLTIGTIEKKLPLIDHYPTPNPLEIVVTLRQENDNPDDLAIFVESLRYGFGHNKEWVSLPAPLFFERVVRDYISEFAITDEEDTTSEIEEKFTQLSLFDYSSSL